MTDPKQKLDPIEALLKQASSADEAGVFDRTPVRAERLLRESWQEPVPLRATIGRKWIPVAAAIGIAAILWPVMFEIEFGSVREKVRLAQQQAAEHGSVRLASHISGCVAGPMSSGGRPCGDYDFDSDGDIDLADFSRYQLAYADVGG